MYRLRPRERKVFSGFTTSEIERMEKSLRESRDQYIDQGFCKRLANSFSYSKGRAGKPAVKWTQVQSWFQERQRSHPLKDASSPNPPQELPAVPGAFPLEKTHENPQESKVFGDVISKTGEKVPDLSELEFEARSSDGAWYDVDTFLTHRFCTSGEAEVRVRFVGFGSEGDEWVNVRKDIRERSLPLEDSECGKVNVGDRVICFQERGDEARYYDAHVFEILRRMHDIRGCRCLFLIRYDHDNTQASNIFSDRKFCHYCLKLQKARKCIDTLFHVSGKSSFEKIMLPANVLELSIITYLLVECI